MVNYYEELGLDRSLGLDELNRQLSRVESTWKSRRTRVPEKATRMLAMVIDAREVFADSGKRSEYDRALDASKAEPSANQASPYTEEFLSWKRKAEGFRDSGEYDLAVSALNRALRALAGKDADIDFYLLAADVYARGGDTTSAMRYANEAILLAPDDYHTYYQKALVYQAIANEEGERNRREESNAARIRMRESLLKADEIARMEGDDAGRGAMLGAYAFSLYFQVPEDKRMAEEYAQKALDLGDPWDNASRVMQDFEEMRKSERERREREAREQAERKARERAAEEKWQKRREQEEAKRAAEEKKEEKKEIQKAILGFVASCLVLAVLFSPFPTLAGAWLFLGGGYSEFSESYKYSEGNQCCQ